VNGFTNTRILVVGGAGFIGSNLVQALLESYPYQIIIVDNLLSAEASNVPAHPAAHFIEGSITSDSVLRALPPDLDYVFHLATFHGNQNSIADPLADHDNNSLTTLKLLERLKSCRKLKKIIYSSVGCTVADRTAARGIAARDDALMSLWLDSPYQISKIIGELYSNYYFKQHGLPIVKARFQHVYGPGEILGAGRWRGTLSTIWRNVIPTFIYRAIRQMPLLVENGGSATRAFIFVEDVVRGLMQCATQGDAGGTYNIASKQETTILELAQLVNQLTGNLAPIQQAEKRPWDRSRKRAGATEAASAAPGFEARIDLAQGLDRTIAWTRSNLPRIEACIVRHQPHLKAAA
jgi:nucleoside-diphosphate-sugar epimerase